MRIAIINGSPKTKESSSQALLDYLLPKLKGQEILSVQIKDEPPAPEVLDRLCACDALLLAFPLYADTFPSHVICLLTALEAHGFPQKTVLYSLINNGFFEGSQNGTVAQQLRIFAQRAGLIFGQAVGVGAGELHRALKSIPFGKGPNKSVGRAMDQLAEHMLRLESAEDLFTMPDCPHGLWNFLAKTFMWHAQAKKNGLQKKELYRRQDAQKLP